MRWSIRSKLAVSAVLALVPLVAFFGFATQSLLLSSLDTQMGFMRAYLVVEARGTIYRHASTLDSLLADRLLELGDRARTLASLPAAQSAAQRRGDGRYGLQGTLCAACQGLDLLLVTDRQGRVIARGHGGRPGGQMAAGSPLARAVQLALAGQATAGPEVLDQADLARERTLAGQRLDLAAGLGGLPAALALVAAQPIRIGPRVVGVVVAADLLNRDRRLLDRYRDITGSPAALSLGSVRVATNIPFAWGALGSRLPPVTSRRVLAGQRFLAEDREGRAWHYQPLLGSTGQVVGCLETGSSLASLNAALAELESARRGLAESGKRGLLLRLVGAALVALLMGGVVAGGIAAPIRELRREVQLIAQGDFDAARNLNIRTGDEIQQLAEDFTTMAERLREARDQERMALVGQMASSVVHDLRNPLTAIQGFAPLLADPQTSPEQKQEFLQAIEQESARISTMLSQLLEFSRGREALERSLQPLDGFVQATAAVMAMDLKLAHIELEVQAESGAQVLLDANRMGRVLTNLVTNAREAMPEGGKITIRTSAQGKLAAITVSDTGPGVPPEVQQHLFAPFYTHGKSKGTGLGLAICKQIVTAHGGTITLEPSLSPGATFRISLPIVQGMA